MRAHQSAGAGGGIFIHSFCVEKDHKVVQTASERWRRLIPLSLGVATLAGVALLYLEDVAPQLFPKDSHIVFSAFPLAMIAPAYVAFQVFHRRTAMELAKALLVAAAFLFWAANQFWPQWPEAALFNDIAIGLFVLDVFLVIAGWPEGSNASFPDDCCGCCAGRGDGGCGGADRSAQ